MKEIKKKPTVEELEKLMDEGCKIIIDTDDSLKVEEKVVEENKETFEVFRERLRKEMDKDIWIGKLTVETLSNYLKKLEKLFYKLKQRKDEIKELRICVENRDGIIGFLMRDLEKERQVVGKILDRIEQDIIGLTWFIDDMDDKNRLFEIKQIIKKYRKKR